MLRYALLAVLATASFAQTAPEAAQNPPAGLDEALRARISEFYQLHVAGEYRKAEKLVAEDSQDIYYESSKPKYLGFEIKTIKYSEDFTKAKVSVTCEQYATGLIGMAGKAIKMPSTSSWKFVDGKWFWYVSPEDLARGPMGKIANAGTKPAPGAKAAPENIPTTPEFALGKVKWEKDSLAVKPNQHYQLTISNTSAGTVGLVLRQVLPGIETSIDKANLNAGEKAVVTFKTGENPFTGVIAFRVDPMGEEIAIVVKRQAAEAGK